MPFPFTDQLEPPPTGIIPIKRPWPGELPRDPRVRLVADVLSYATGVPVEAILCRGRTGVGVARLRHVAMYLFSVVYAVGASNTAHAFGRERTTAHYALKKIEDARQNAAFDTWIASLERTLLAAPDLGGRA